MAFTNPLQNLGRIGKTQIQPQQMMTPAQPPMSVEQPPMTPATPVQNTMPTGDFNIQREIEDIRRKYNVPTKELLAQQQANIPGIDTSIGGIVGVNTPTISPTLQTPQFAQGVQKEFQTMQPQQQQDINTAIQDFQTQGQEPIEQPEMPDIDPIYQQNLPDIKNVLLDKIKNNPKYAGIDVTDKQLTQIATDPEFLQIMREEAPELFTQEKSGGVIQGIQNIIGGISESAGGLNKFTSGIGKDVGIYLGQKIRTLLGKPELTPEQLAQMEEQYGDFGSTPITDFVGADRDSNIFKGVKTVSDLVQVLSPTGGGKFLATKIGGYSPQLMKMVQSISKTAPSWLKKTTQLATQGAKDTAKFTAVSEGEIPTSTELAGGAGLNVLLGGAGRLIKPLKNIINNAPEQLMSSSIKLNPSQIEKIAKPNIAGVSPEKWLLENNVVGNLPTISKKLDKIATQSLNTLNSSVKKIQGVYKSNNATTALKTIDDKLKDIPGLEEEASTVKNLLDKSENGQTSLSDLLETKRLMDSWINIYKRSGEVKDQAMSKGLAKIRDNLKNEIETIGKTNGLNNIKQLSKDIQVAIEINKGIQKTIDRQSRNKIFSLSDAIVAAGLGGGAYATNQDPLNSLVSIGGIILSKRILENPSFKTNLAIGLKKLSESTQSTIQKYIMDGKIIPKNTQNSLRRIIDQSIIKSLSPNE